MTHTFSANWFEENRWQFERNFPSVKNANLLEIGSFEGQSTCWMLDRLPDAQITCIDICEQEAFWTNIDSSNARSRITLHIGPSADILPTLPKSHYDFVFVDGSHATIDVLEDAVMAFRRAKVGATIAFDDYLWGLGDTTPKDAVDAFLRIYKRKITVISKNYQVWVRKDED